MAPFYSNICSHCPPRPPPPLPPRVNDLCASVFKATWINLFYRFSCILSMHSMINSERRWCTWAGSIRNKQIGQCGGSVGRAVASDSRGPRFESCHRQNFTVNSIEKTKIKKKRPGMAH